MSSNDAGHTNDTRALAVAQSYAQPPTPSERCNNLRAKNRALLEENDKLRATLANWYQQPKGDHMAEEFKSGDVVKLKSGGPKMTVRNRSAEPIASSFAMSAGYVTPSAPKYERPVTCDWFDLAYENHKANSGTFEEAALELVTT